MKNATKIMLTVIIATMFIGVGFVIFQNSITEEKTANGEPTTQIPEEADENKNPNDQISISLSTDKKDLVTNNNEVLLTIENDTIFDWFKTESQLCDEYNLTSAPDRQIFCENKTVFREKTKFTTIVVSPDKMQIGFTIESEALSPDTVVGIFSRSTSEVTLLTNYYLGNEFLGFSPNGTNFIYTGECLRSMCGLFVKDSKTLAQKASINNPEYLDYKVSNAEFIQWISDNEVEYRLKSNNSDDVKTERKSFAK